MFWYVFTKTVRNQDLSSHLIDDSEVKIVVEYFWEFFANIYYIQEYIF